MLHFSLNPSEAWALKLFLSVTNETTTSYLCMGAALASCSASVFSAPTGSQHPAADGALLFAGASGSCQPCSITQGLVASLQGLERCCCCSWCQQREAAVPAMGTGCCRRLRHRAAAAGSGRGIGQVRLKVEETQRFPKVV